MIDKDSIDALCCSSKEMDAIFDEENNSTLDTTETFEESSLQRSPLSIETNVERDSEFYEIDNKFRGYVQIFNQKIFMNRKRYEERIGTDADVERLKKTLPRLGFKPEHIIVHNNLNKQKIYSAILKLEENDILKDCDCLLTIILTHGGKDDQIMAFDESYHLYEFVEKFTPSSFKYLAQKPKIFLVQACRGPKHDCGVVMNAQGMSFDKTDVKVLCAEEYTYPKFADFLIGFSSHYDHCSFRKESGSWYIQEFCNVIENCVLFNINDILVKTNANISKRLSASDNEVADMKKQISGFYTTFTKQFVFKP